jgi:CHAT domain-containing protein
MSQGARSRTHWRRLLVGLLLGLCLSLGGGLRLESGWAQTAFEQGLAAYNAGQYPAAIAHWQSALDTVETLEQAAPIWGNLAIAYYETGQYRRAIEANQTAIAQFTELQQPGAVGQVQSNLGNVYEALGTYDRAVEMYQAALATARAQGDRVAEGISLGNLGYLYFLQGERARALAAYQASLAIAEETGDREGASHRYLNLGIAHHAVDELALAQAAYQRSLTLAEAIDHFTLQAKALSSLGMVAAEQGDLESAIAYYQQSLALSDRLQNPELQARTRNNFGHALLAANRLDEAETQLRDAIARMDTLRDDLTDRDNVAIFDTQIYTYNLLKQILVAKGDPEAALEVAEAGRARAFAQLLRSRSGGENRLTVAGDVPFKIADMQQLARDTNATLVEYSLVPEDSFRVIGRQRGRTADIHIWVIQPDGRVTFRQTRIAPDDVPLEDLVQRSRQSLGVGGRGIGVVATANPDVAAQALAQLYQRLVAPIQDLLPVDPTAKLVFVPQESLFLVPFAALQDDHGDYLIQHHTVLSAPSLQVLALKQQAPSTASRTPSPLSDALVVGNPTMPVVWEPTRERMAALDPLPGAEAEALQIATKLNAEALIGNRASEKRVKTRMATAPIIHLATHGLLEYGEPIESGIRDVPGAIALAPTDDQDGLLTSTEILNELSMNADLVVLSACDTGRGEITGDGVNGLARAFLGAGAKNLIVSLWSVPDAPTAELMVSFYDELAQGQNQAQALRLAMLSTFQTHPNPRDWAAFTLVGRL